MRFTRFFSAGALFRFFAAATLSFLLSAPVPGAEPRPSLPGVPYAFAPSVGTLRLLVLLINFPGQTPLFSPEQFQELLFSRHSYPSGSLADYYHETSYGRLRIEGEVRGWYQAAEPPAFYAGNAFGRNWALYPRSMGRLVEEAVALAAGEGVDFSVYDHDHDGHVDGLVVIHQGPGGDITNRPEHLWTTMDYISRGRGTALVVNGVLVDRFILLEELYPPDRILPVGIVAHELGHALGLPDFYQHGGRLAVAGVYDLMSAGVWGRADAARPFHLSAYSKMKLGWLEPRIITGRARLALAPIETNPEAVRLNTPRSGEYFLLEHRGRLGFDEHLPGEGLLIWQVDETVRTGNNQPCLSCCARHPLLALEQADGRNDLERGRNRGDAEDFFPGPNREHKIFASNTGTGPEHKEGAHSLTWNCELSGVKVSDLRLSEGKVWFTARDDDSDPFYRDWPWLVLRTVRVEEVDGDGDGRAEPGETVRLSPVLFNQGAKAKRLRLTADAPGLNFSGGPAKIAKLGPRQEMNPTPGLELKIPSDFGPARTLELKWTITLRKPKTQMERVASLVVGTPEILLVNAAGPGLAGLYQEILEKLQEPYEVWDLTVQGVPPLSRLKDHQILIWLETFSGSAEAWPTLAGQAVLEQYLAEGGNLLLIAPGLGRAKAGEPEAVGAWLEATLQVKRGTAFGGLVGLRGVEGDLISRGQKFGIHDLFGYPSLPVYSEIAPGDGAAVIYTDLWGHVVGVRFPAACSAGWKAVTLSFSFEALPLPAQMQALSRILAFFRQPVDAPVVDSLRPSAGARGAAGFKILLTGLNLKPELSADLGEGIQVIEQKSENPDRLELTIQIAPDARIGPRDLILRAPGQEPVVLPRAFTVIP